MNKSILFFGAFLCFIGGMFSCYDENNTYGENLVSSVFRNITIDTCTVVVTAVKIDSLETSGKNVALAGQYRHPTWGEITSSVFTPYSRPNYSTDVDEIVTFDSLKLRLIYTGKFVGDTSAIQQFSIHELSERITLNDNGYLYNHSTVLYEPEPLAVFSFRPRPQTDDTLDIRLSDELGENLLARFHARDEAVSGEWFEDFFKGLTILPDPGVSQSLLYFQVGDSALAMTLHYHIADEFSSTKELLFTPESDRQFNHIDHDQSGSALESYTTEIRSDSLGNRGFIFCGIGWYSRLEFPYLNNIMQHGEQVEIQSAYLQIYPELNSYSDLNVLPDSIYLYIADENNVVTDAVTDYLGDELQNATLTKDDIFPENTCYIFDISQFLKEELGAVGMNKHNLQLVFDSDDYTGTFRNLTFGDQEGQLPITLHLTYKIYESY